MDVSKIMEPLKGYDSPPKITGLAVPITAIPLRLLPEKRASAPTVPTKLEAIDPSERGVLPNALVGSAFKLRRCTWRGVTKREPVRWGWRTSIGGRA